MIFFLLDGSTDEKLSKKPMKSFNQAETVADMNQRQRFPNVKSEKSYEGTVICTMRLSIALRV